MKKVLLVIFAFISLNLFSQINVKEGSFRKIEGFVMLDKMEHNDDNDNPMSLIKITTEKMDAEQRAELRFSGNLETYFDKRHMEDGQIYLYISSVAPFIEIIHPYYGKTEYHFPFDLCDYCGYEMVIQHNPLGDEDSSKPHNTYLVITTDQLDAVIYIDDEYAGMKEATRSFETGSTHTWRIECDMHHSETGKVTLYEKTEINKTLRPAYGYLEVTSQPESGAVVFLDNKRVGLTPYKSQRLPSGKYNVKVVKDMYQTAEKSFEVKDNQTTKAVLNMAANFVNVTVTTDPQADIYIDEKYYGKGSWNGRLIAGNHFFEARKESHKTSSKNVDLVLGKDAAVTISNPEPICGYLDITTTPMKADIYIDGKYFGQTPDVIPNVLVGKHKLKLTKQGCADLSKDIFIEKDETLVINETLQTAKEVVIKTGQNGDLVYVDDNYIGVSPVTTKLSYGKHTVKVLRGNNAVNKEIEVQSYGKSEFDLSFAILTIKSSKVGDEIYLDGNKLGVTPKTFDVSLGKHNFEVKRGKLTENKTISVTNDGVQSYYFSPMRSKKFQKFFGDYHILLLNGGLAGDDKFVNSNYSLGLSLEGTYDIKGRSLSTGWFLSGMMGLPWSYSGIAGFTIGHLDASGNLYLKFGMGYGRKTFDKEKYTGCEFLVGCGFWFVDLCALTFDLVFTDYGVFEIRAGIGGVLGRGKKNKTKK